MMEIHQLVKKTVVLSQDVYKNIYKYSIVG